MTVTAEMILTDFGAKLPLNRRRKDALAEYAKAEARQAGISAERWVREQFDFKAYEAKEVVRGTASETLWERILYHPNGGWNVALPILGAVIGLGIGRFFVAQAEIARKEAERAQLAEHAYGQAALVAVHALGSGLAAPDDRVAPGVADLLALSEGRDVVRSKAGRS